LRGKLSALQAQRSAASATSPDDHGGESDAAGQLAPAHDDVGPPLSEDDAKDVIEKLSTALRDTTMKYISTKQELFELRVELTSGASSKV